MLVKNISNKKFHSVKGIINPGDEGEIEFFEFCNHGDHFKNLTPKSEEGPEEEPVKVPPPKVVK